MRPLLTTDLTRPHPTSPVQVDESLLTDDCAPPPPYMATPLPGGGLVRLSLDTETSSSRASTALGQDVLSVTYGEPDTHINLDLLLNIVQSFQLDTTHAANEPGPGGQAKKV